MPPIDIELIIPVRTYDIDSAGHVSNIVYVRWLEDLRLELFDKHFSFQSLLEDGCTLVLKSTHVEYKHSIRLFDRVRARMKLDSVAKASIGLRAQFFVGDLMTTEANHVGVFVDLKNMKPRRVPQGILDKFISSSLS